MRSSTGCFFLWVASEKAEHKTRSQLIQHTEAQSDAEILYTTANNLIEPHSFSNAESMCSSTQF